MDNPIIDYSSAIQGYLSNGPRRVTDRAILITDTAKLIGMLLSDNFGIPLNSISLESLIQASISACSALDNSVELDPD